MKLQFRSAFNGLAILALFAGTLPIPAPAQDGKAKEKSADIKAIESVFEKYRAYGTGDAAAKAAVFVEDGELIIHAKRWAGRDAIRKWFENSEKTKAGIEIKHKITDIYFFRPDSAIVDVQYELPDHTDRGTHVFVRENLDWRIGVYRVYGYKKKNLEADAQKIADKKALEALFDAWTAAVNKRDAAAVARLFTKDGDMIFHDGPKLRGRETIQTSLEESFASLPDTQRLKISVTDDIRFLTPDLAIVETEATHSEGEQLKNRGTLVMAREAGEWKVVSLRVYAAHNPGGK